VSVVRFGSGALQVSRDLLAGAPVGWDLARDLLALNEAAQTRSLDGADVHEHVLATLVRLNEAVAFGLVESLWVTFPAACGVTPVDEPEFWTDGSLASTVGRHANEVMVSDYVKKQGQDYQKLHENRQLALF